MTEDAYSRLLGVALDKVRAIADAQTVVGTPILGLGGLTVIPVSRVSVGLALGGADSDRPAKNAGTCGGGGGSGMNVTPMAFLVITEDGHYDLLPVKDPKQKDFGAELCDLIRQAPDLVKKWKKTNK